MVSDDIDPLTRIAIRHGTDKWGVHFYTPIYHELFAAFRDKPVRLLEIGVGGYDIAHSGGASLAMWTDYFSQGQIVGIDIADKKLALGPRTHFRRGSQDDTAFLARVSDEFGPFDIVIDDGSHVPKHVVASFGALFPKVNDGGLYVIEDVQTTFWPNFGGSALDGGATMGLARMVLEYLNHAEIKAIQPQRQISDFAKSIRSLRAYHNVLVIEKGDNTEPSNAAYRLDHPHAAEVVRSIEAEMAVAPTPAGYANLISVLASGGDRTKAAAHIEDCLKRWPDHTGLLVAALGAAAEWNDIPGKIRYTRALLKQEPDNSLLQRYLRAYEEELEKGIAVSRAAFTQSDIPR